MKRVLTMTAALVFFLTFGLRGAPLHDGPHVGPDDEVFSVGNNGDVNNTAVEERLDHSRRKEQVSGQEAGRQIPLAAIRTTPV